MHEAVEAARRPKLGLPDAADSSPAMALNGGVGRRDGRVSGAGFALGLLAGRGSDHGQPSASRAS